MIGTGGPTMAAYAFAVLAVVLVTVLLVMGILQDGKEKRDDCARLGGQVVYGGRGGDDVCVKDGLIVKVYR